MTTNRKHTHSPISKFHKYKAFDVTSCLHFEFSVSAVLLTTTLEDFGSDGANFDFFKLRENTQQSLRSILSHLFASLTGQHVTFAGEGRPGLLSVQGLCPCVTIRHKHGLVTVRRGVNWTGLALGNTGRWTGAWGQTPSSSSSASSTTSTTFPSSVFKTETSVLTPCSPLREVPFGAAEFSF